MTKTTRFLKMLFMKLPHIGKPKHLGQAHRPSMCFYTKFFLFCADGNTVVRGTMNLLEECIRERPDNGLRITCNQRP